MQESSFRTAIVPVGTQPVSYTHLLEVYKKLGIPIEEQKVLAGVEGARKVAVDAVFDSVSVATTFREELKRAGVILSLIHI